MHGVGQETTKRNSAMRSGPSLFKNMNRYHKKGLSGINASPLSIEEEVELKHRMELAKRKGNIREAKFYLLSTGIGLGLFYILYQIFI